ncbi:MAG: nickel pincer cofactor biosynthesis protein LarC [Caldilineaceae bacterium]|nr:nickel pincer cofactor biosynthesis protein LarC [Caldilineaceae bacterium]
MIAFLDMPSGISGDMFLGCLVDGGWPLAALEETIRRLKLPAGSWRVAQTPVMRGPLAATLLEVDAAEGDHHRHLSDILAIIAQSDLPAQVQARASAVFRRLAEAEAAVHGTSVEAIHFHEVGALDAIIDIVGVCAGLDALGVTQLYAGSVPLGEGWANTAHGHIPLPAPATLALLSAVHAPTRPAPGPGELVTPTGAALLAELAIFRRPPIRLQRVGQGAGRKEFGWPNVARLWFGEEDAGTGAPADRMPAASDTSLEYASLEYASMVVLETNIDDMNPELYAAAGAALFAGGAVDVWLTPIQMKKGRPAVLLSVLAPPEQEGRLAMILLRETTTLGVRVQPVGRYAAARALRTVATRYGPLAVKLKLVAGAVVGVKPEQDDCARLAAAQGVPVRAVYEAALAAAYAEFLAEQLPS